MKHRGKSLVLLLAGILMGCALSGPAAYAAAEAISACRSSHVVCVDGNGIELEAYVIEGNNYVKLRDVGEAVGFNVWWDGENHTVQIESDRPYTGIPPAEKGIADIDENAPTGTVETDTADVNPAVLTGAYTPEFYATLRSAILTGSSEAPVRLTEEAYSAMLEAAAAVGCWPVYDLKSDAEGMCRIVDRYPEPYAEAAAYCQPFIDSLTGQSDRERVKQLAFFVCDRIEYDGSAYCSPRTALVSNEVQRGACMSYAQCFKFLCDLAGIPCILTHSDDHQWNLAYVEENWWHVDVSNVDVRASDRRDSLTVLHEGGEMQGSAYRQSQPQLTELAKELMIPGSTR
ncbi:MAG: hypothetical protein IKO68_03700 [Oscillospiraceae bacterium]|nr:hypothetical protein [Oscillospiraceae bacterium]